MISLNVIERYKKISKFLTMFIPISSIRKKARTSFSDFLIKRHMLKLQLRYINITHKHYKVLENRIIEKCRVGAKVKVCFFVLYDSSFSAEPLYKKMLEDDIFEPFIVVSPDTLRGDDNMFYQMDKTYKTLSSKYNNVFKSYDVNSKQFIDYKDRCDLAYLANPYDGMTHELYSVRYLCQYCLLFYVSYFYNGVFNFTYTSYKELEYNLFWRVFLENDNTFECFKSTSLIKGKNAELVGYLKMDMLDMVKASNLNKKTIIIASHHTIDSRWNAKNGGINISNFLRLYNFYLKLPALYPDVIFIFRPHPLLFINLRKDEYWGGVKTEQYLNKLKSFSNVVIQEGGSYFETFVDSDALINDCNSFTSEYLYTDKPSMFIVSSNDVIDREFTDFGKKLLNNLYVGITEQDIIDFIDMVVIGGNDFKKVIRNDFANKYVKINYPHSTDKCISIIKNNILERFYYE